MNKEFAKKFAEIKGWPIEKVDTIDQATRTNSVYQSFVGFQKLPDQNSKSWLESIKNNDPNFDKNFDKLLDLWGKNVLYSVAVENFYEMPNTKELMQLLGNLITAGFQLRNCKTFSKNCHEMLDILYDMGVKTPEDIAKAIDAIKMTYVLSGMSRRDSSDIKKNEEAVMSVMADVKKTIEMAKNYRMVSNEFSGLTL